MYITVFYVFILWYLDRCLCLGKYDGRDVREYTLRSRICPSWFVSICGTPFEQPGQVTAMNMTEGMCA